jgi:hypothetical protein
MRDGAEAWASPDAPAEGGAATPLRSPTLAGLLGADAPNLIAALGRDAWRGRIGGEGARALFDWPRLNSVLEEQRFDASRLYLSGPGAVRVTDASGRVRSAELMAAVRDGATLIVNAASEASAPLRRLCEGLAAEFTAYCQANLYACWRDTPGFNVHWDDHDVLVVQAEGRKRWDLYGVTREAPMLQLDPADHLPPPEPREQIVLQAGDILYLPRGYWHAAVGLGEPSLHLTIGLTRRTGADFLRWLADQLLTETWVRRDLPFEAGDGAMAVRFAEILNAACDQPLEALAAAYRRHVEASLPGRAALSFPAIGGAETRLSASDVLVLAPGPARLESGPGGDAIVLTWRGARFTVSARLRPVLERLLAVGEIDFDELSKAASNERAADFARDMIGRGVLQLRPGGAGLD